jgi:outer membrane protein assembly factor BamB
VSGLTIIAAYPSWAGKYQVVVGNLGYSDITGAGLGTNTYITAFNLLTGTRAWRHKISDHFLSGHYVPAISGGVLFVGGLDDMYAFNAVSGRQLWVTGTGSDGNFNEVTVANGIVYDDTSLGGTLYAFSAANGQLLWSALAPGCCLIGAVTVAGGLAYESTDAGLVAYNATTGAHVFTATAADQTDTVVVGNGLAFMYGSDALQALNATTGALVWTVGLPGETGPFTPAVDGDTLVIATARSMTAFSADSGAQLWSVSDGYDYSVPAIADGVVYGAALLDAGVPNQGLQAIDEATGSILYAGYSGCADVVIAASDIYAECSFAGGEAKFGL